MWKNRGKDMRLMWGDNYHSYSVGLYPLAIEKILGAEKITGYNPQWTYQTHAPEFGKFKIGTTEFEIYYEYEEIPLYSLRLKKEDAAKIPHGELREDHRQWLILGDLDEDSLIEKIKALQKLQEG